MSRWFGLSFCAVLLLAAALRLPELRLRPMHNDEAVNAMKFRDLWAGTGYRYDPNEFHGPTLPYFTLPLAGWSGPRHFEDLTEATFRLVPALFGIASIVLLLGLTPEFGRAETLWAALFAAVSPAMVFYSRYYIHEIPLLFFTAMAATAGWRYCRTGRFFWCATAGAGVALMWATKETFIIDLASLLLALVCAALWGHWRGEKAVMAVVPWHFRHFAGAAGIGLVIGLAFYSSFFTHWAGMADAFKTYFPWFHRAEGISPHVHPWAFYWERLLWYHANGGPVWSEALIVALALVGFVLSLTGRGLEPVHDALARSIALYTAWMTLVYTVLPYKTTWCLLGFYQGMIFLAGLGAAALVRAPKTRPGRWTLVVLLLTGAGQLGWQSWRGNFAVDKGGVPYCDTAKNPYTYSQTTPDIYRLMEAVNGLALASPEGYRTVVEVMSPQSYWPLPWYLRRFQAVGYWDHIPAQPLAPIMIVSTDLHANFDERPEKSHLMAGYYELRPNVFFELYVSVDLWTRYLKTLPPDKRQND
jgi:uncharacterized protein (TIGR03663 family)